MRAHKSVSAVGIAAALMLPVPAHPQDSAIEEIVVTAKRRAVDLSSVSSAVSVVARQDIEAAKLVTDALVAAPGVFLQQTTPGQGAPIVRGLKGSAVLNLVDGMRLNNAIFRSAPTQYLALVPVSAIERLEVVRGTPTALYGSDAVGGVVQAVTRRPSFDGATTELHGASFAGFDSAELEKSLWSTLDVGNRGFVTSLGAEYRQTGNRRTGGGERIGPSGYETRAARALFARMPSDTETWALDLHWLEQPETPRVDELVPGFGQTEPSSSEYFFAPNQRLFAHARHRNSAGPLGLDWTFDLAWQRIVDDRRSRDFGAGQRRLEQNRSDLFGAVANVTGGSGDGVSWLAGADLYHDHVRSRRFEEDVETGQRSEVAARFPDGSTVRQAAVYGSLDWSLGDRHRLSAGARFTRVAVDLAETVLTAADSLDVNDLSGDIGWIFERTDSLQLLANLGFGFRAPNIFDLGSLGDRPGNRFNVPNADLDSEHVVHADVGFRFRHAGWELQAFYFRLDYSDRIISVDTGEMTPSGRDVVQSVNAANATVSGLEALLGIELGRKLRLDALLNYARGQQRQEGGDREPGDRIPPLNGLVRLSWDASVSWRLRASAIFSDRQDRLSARDISDVRIDPEGTPGWGIVKLEAERQLGSEWKITVAVDNVFDKRYRRHGSGLDAPGRNFALALRRDWTR